MLRVMHFPMFRFIMFAVYMPFNNAKCCLDTLRDERGDIHLYYPPEQEGVDFCADQVVIKVRNSAIILPSGKNEAALQECNIEKDIKTALDESKAYYISKVYPNSSPGDTLRVIDDSITVRVPDVSNTYKILLESGSDENYAIDLLWAMMK